jgi:Flp pilus assembly protein TadD
MRYSPLTLLGWSITYQFLGDKPFWFHLGNWLMHGVSAGLVFLVLRKLLLLAISYGKTLNEDSRRITIASGLGALLWSLHPLRVEPVAWCTDRAYCQALLFLLPTLLFYLWANEPGISTRRYYLLLPLSVVFYIVSLLSHAIGMTFFLVLIVLDVYLFRKLNFGSKWWKISSNRHVLFEKIPFAVSAAVIALITVSIRIISAGVWKKPVSPAQFGITARLWQALYIWAYYIWRPWYPVNLSPVYTTLVTFKPFWVFIFSAILLIGIIKLSMALQPRWPLGITLITCHLFLLIPVLGIFEHPHFPCDRYSLIVSILWSVLLAAWLAYPKTKTVQYRISITLTSIIIVILGFLTLQQTRVWTNSKTLFTHVIKTLGNDPYRSDIYRRLGIVYTLEGNIDEGIKYLAKTVEIDPDDVPAQNQLGLLLMEKNKAEEALEHFEWAIQAKPGYDLAHINHARALIMLGRFDEALESLDKFIRQNPDSAKGNYWLSVALAKTGKTGQAVTHLKKTLTLSPDWVEPINDLARILATSQDSSLRNPDEAIRLAQRGCELTKYQEADSLDTLAVAYASAGNFSEAVYYAKEALSLAKPSSETALVEKIRSHLYSFQQGRMCDE